jgi:hypothetical protein
MQFDELVMADGRHMPLQTVASLAPDGVLRFVSANENAEEKQSGGCDIEESARDTAGDSAAMERFAETDRRAGVDAQAETDCTSPAASSSAIH